MTSNYLNQIRRLILNQPTVVYPDAECKRTHLGNEYMGRQGHSQYGKPCIPWTDIPQSTFALNDSHFPDESVQAAHNWCRNPADHANTPWCFTDMDGNYELCHVIHCSKWNICHHHKETLRHVIFHNSVSSENASFHYTDVTWAWWRLNSAATHLFAQCLFMLIYINKGLH